LARVEQSRQLARFGVETGNIRPLSNDNRNVRS